MAIINRQIETQAQQSYRFYLIVDDLPVAYITEVDRPSYTISTQEYRLLNYYLRHPTDIKWNPITFTIREIFSKNEVDSILGSFMKRMRQVHSPPTGINKKILKDLSKRDLMNSLGGATVNGQKYGSIIKIQMLDPEGDVYEEWEVHGAFISDVKPSQLGYSKEDLTGITVTLTYDWAELKHK